MRIFFRNRLFLWFCFLVPAHQLFAQTQKIYLNPATAGAAPQSKFVEITRITPIDAPNEKINTNTSLFITSKYWILYDYFEKKIYFFTKEAKFIQKFELKKYGDPVIVYDGKNEILKFNIKNKNYILTNNDLVNIRANADKKANQKYFKNYEIDLKQAQLQLKNTPTDPYFIANARWYYNDYYYRSDLAIDPNTKDTLGYELELLQNNKVVRSFFPFNKTSNPIFRYAAINSGAQIYLYGSDTASIAYTARPFNSIIYKLDKDSIQPVYEVILPAENAIPRSVLSNGFKSKAAWENFQNSNGNIFFSINSIRNIQNYLFLGIRFMRNYDHFLYDKKESKFYKNKMIKADSSQYNIQLLQSGLGQYNNGSYYTIVPASALVDFYTKNKENNVAYPPALEQFLKSATKNSNPVIVEYKLKN
ncbi:MAG: hypothetical protein WKF35_11215 [Ferruginibacter sp.]